MRLVDADAFKAEGRELYRKAGWDLREVHYSQMDVECNIDMMPTIEVEPFTDKEQRIFLAAMAREEKVCKEVDEECRDCREPYEDSLVKTCHEITRKVKSVLWT